jgi:N-acetylglucosamine malate deacetylase 1
MADILVFAPHPDDAEIHCGGIIAAHVRQGASVVIVDATRGELGSRGTVDMRAREAQHAADILGVQARENLQLTDGAIPSDDIAARTVIVDCLRRHRPRTVLCIHEHAHHPDHQHLPPLIKSAIKTAALHKFATPSNLPAVSDIRLWFYEAELPLIPSVLVPLSNDDWQKKMAAIQCYGSQLFNPDSTEPPTSIATPEFLTWIEARGKMWGHHVGAPYAEALVGFTAACVRDIRGL